MKPWGPFRRKPGRQRRRARQTGPRCPITRKPSYLSYRVANKAARSHGEANHPHLCVYCGWWHVTSMTKAEYDRHQLRYFAPVKEETDMAFNEPAPATGERTSPADLAGHLLIVYPVGYKDHVQTKFTRPDKPSNCVIVDIIDLTQNGDDGKPGKVFRAVMFFQARLIQGMRPMVGKGAMLGTIQKGVASNGMQAPWEFVSLTSNAEAVAKAEAWMEDNEFVPTTKEAAELDRPQAPQPQQHQGWPQGAVPAQQWQPQQHPGQQPMPAQQQWTQPQQQQWTQPSQPTPPAQQWQQQPMPPMPPQAAQPQPATSAEMSILERLRQQQGAGFQGQSPEQQQFGY